MTGRAPSSEDPLVRAALASAKLPPLLAHATRAALNGLWLGVLSDAGLRALDERYYDAAEMYRTDEWNEKGLFPWERELIDEHFGDATRTVVAACGGGREVLGLLECGHDAFGYEPHGALASYAHEFLAARGHASRAEASPRDVFPPAAGHCDAVVLGWGAYSLMHRREGRVAFLAAARERLPRGGPVLISFFARARDSRELRSTRAIANALRGLRGRPPVELGDTLAPNLVHVFSRDELEREAAVAGFETAGYRTIGPADESTSYAAAVVRST